MTLNVQNKEMFYGLVLAGGRSVRMGHDKTTISWHGREQRYYMADMLQPFCERVYISCRRDQEKEIDPAYSTLPDVLDIAGPLNGIVSALQAHPSAAWLVVACDLPLIDAPTIEYLISQRDKTGMATTFRSPFDGLPEPLITIWEPSALLVLRAHITDGYHCPRKALIRNQAMVKIIESPEPEKLLNANTPADAAEVKRLLKN